MKKIETRIKIDKPAQQVWEKLTDFQELSNWNPFLKKITGDPLSDNEIEVLLKVPGSDKTMTFKPRVLKFEKNREFRWKGKLLMPGIFDGEHYFILDELSENGTEFIHGEIFSGILIPFMGGMLEDTENGFDKMNEALKYEVEAINFT